MTNWIRDTGQQWKLFVSYAFLLMLALCAAAAILAFNGAMFSDTAVLLGLLWAAFGLTTFSWLAFAFRCESCGARPKWWLMNHADAGNWFVQFLHAERCPICASAAERLEKKE